MKIEPKATFMTSVLIKVLSLRKNLCGKDHGVAVYFKHGERSMVFACDKWDAIRDNIYAIGKTIEALRGIERWGASDMLERAFTGFIALENMSSEKWQDILQVGNTYTPEECERHYKILAKDAHPDRCG